MGTGRVNLFKALSTSGSPAIELDHVDIDDGYDGMWNSGDTLDMVVTVTNFLAPSGPLTLNLSTQSIDAEIFIDSSGIGPLGTEISGDNQSYPFRIRISDSAASGGTINFKLLISDTSSYQTYANFSIDINLDYLNLTENRLHTTISSTGDIGYRNPYQQKGIGISKDDQANMVYDAGFMIGRKGKVSDKLIGSISSLYDADFSILQSIRVIPSSLRADHESVARFDDSNAGAPLSVQITQRSLVYTTSPDDSYVILEYVVTNKGATDLDSVYAGIFTDWDIQSNDKNRAETDSAKRVGYVQNIQPGGWYGGVKVLSSTKFNHYAIDNNPTGSGGVIVSDGFSPAEKFKVISQPRNQAGTALGGGDVISVVSSGPYDIPKNDSVTIAFAILANESLEGLLENGQRAQLKYDPTLTGIYDTKGDDHTPRITAFPNPGNNILRISSQDQHPIVAVEILDMNGKLVCAWPHLKPTGTTVTLSLPDLIPGAYLIRTQDADGMSSFTRWIAAGK